MEEILEKEQIEEKQEKTGKTGWLVFRWLMFFWAIVCICAVAVGLDRFYGFLKDYQQVYEETRPSLMMEELLTKFDEADVDWMLQHQSDTLVVSKFETEENLRRYLWNFLQGKKVAYTTKQGEHIEERPVYVVTLDKEPFAVIRLQKQEETAKYGHPLWQLRELELFVNPQESCMVTVPENASVYVNEILLSEEEITEVIHENEKSVYYSGFSDIVVLPGYKTYCIGGLYEKPQVRAENFCGEALELTCTEENTYTAGFGASETGRPEVEALALSFLKDYALVVTNDAAHSVLDKYFTEDSELLAGIKEYPSQWYDDHMRPEFYNEAIKELVVFTENALSVRAYVEQYMYVPFSGKVEKLVTEKTMYYVKIGGEWKISGIAFE